MAKTTKKKLQYWGTGRRKKAIARVRLIPNGTGAIVINKRHLEDYFGLGTLQYIVKQPLVLTDTAESVKSKGGVALIVGVTDTLSVIMASGDARVDCRKLLPEVLKQFGGRGGGKPDFAQGGVQDASLADEVSKVLKDTVLKSLN